MLNIQNLAKLCTFGISILSLGTMVFSPLVQAGNLYGEGTVNESIAGDVYRANQAGSLDIRYDIASSNKFLYSNFNNGSYTLEGGASVTQNLATSRHDLYVFHDKYLLENPEGGSLGYTLNIGDNSISAVDISNYLEVYELVNQWDSTDGNGENYDQQDVIIAPGQTSKPGVSVVNGKYNISVTPFGDCTAAAGVLCGQQTIDNNLNFQNQSGWVTIVFRIKEGAPMGTPVVFNSGGAVIEYTSASSGDTGNPIIFGYNYSASSTELGDPGTAKIVSANDDLNTNPSTLPVIGDPNYQILVEDITATNGSPLSNGVCTVDLDQNPATTGDNYTATITNGECLITIPGTITASQIPGGTVLIDDLGSPINIVDSTSYLPYTPEEEDVPTPPTNYNPTELDCTPDTTLINQTVTCTGTLDVNEIVNNLQVQLNGDTGDCTVSGSAITCQPVNVGPNTGVFDITATSDVVTSPVVVDTVSVQEPGSISLSCSPEYVLTGGTVTCQSLASIDPSIPTEGLQVAINGNTASCSLNASNIIICQPVNVGPNVGIFDITYTTTTSPEPTIVDKVEVITLTCTPSSVKSGDQVNCQGTTSPDSQIDEVVINVGGVNNTCVVNIPTITCDDIDYGTSTGSLGVNATISSGDTISTLPVVNLTVSPVVTTINTGVATASGIGLITSILASLFYIKSKHKKVKINILK